MNGTQEAPTRSLGKPSRRQFLGWSAVGVALAGAAGAGMVPRFAIPAHAAGDVDLVQFAISLELAAINAYTAGIPKLSSATAAVATKIQSQHKDHAAALGKAASGLGATPTTTPFALPAPPPLNTETDVLTYALGLENAAAATYLDAIGRLQARDLQISLLTIMGDESEHASVLASALKMDPVPDAFLSTSKSVAPKA
ncbi:MAG: ferritin-like domain-containing protein [Chloroflexota bacterium]